MFKLKHLVRLSVALMLISFAYLLAFPANAASANDINIASAVKLQKFLLAADTLTSEEAKIYDMNHDNKINAIDLTLMKRYLLYFTANDTTLDVINQSLARITPTDLEETLVYSDELYEVKNCSFAFAPNSVPYSYSFLTETETDGASIITNLSLVKGIHIYTYYGKQSIPSVNNPLPDTSEKSFSYDDGTGNLIDFTYSLKAYNQLKNTDIISVARILSGESVVNSDYIAMYDYNLNGEIDTDDLDIVVSYFVSDATNVFPNLNSKMINRFLDNLLYCRKTENFAMLLTDSTAPIEFAINIPTGDITGNHKKSYIWPVQILPASYYSKIKPYITWNQTYSDDEMDYIAWQPIDRRISNVQVENSQFWEFNGGFFAYVLNSDGTYCKDWLFTS